MRQHLHCNGKFTIFLSFLQCGFPIHQGDELLHIFTHHIKKTEDELQGNPKDVHGTAPSLGGKTV